MAGFKTLFLTEWSHRLLAAITGAVALGVLVTVLRDAALRTAVGLTVATAVGLIIVQAILGGLLVDQGTNTPWLWLHQGNAGAIMACLLWSLLVVVGLRPPVVAGRRGLMLLAIVAVLMSWSQLVTGALVAGSKGVEGGYIARDLLAIGNLWNADQGVGQNLMRNPGVAQWLHRWSAWGLTILLAVEILILWRARLGLRLRLVSQLLATFLGVQMLLGLASAAIGAQPLLILAHQATGMCLLLTSVLILFDVRSEPAEAAPQGQTVPSA